MQSRARPRGAALGEPFLVGADRHAKPTRAEMHELGPETELAQPQLGLLAHSAQLAPFGKQHHPVVVVDMERTNRRCGDGGVGHGGEAPVVEGAAMTWRSSTWRFAGWDVPSY